MVVGTIWAIISGAVFPYFLIFFADITTIFNDDNRSTAAARGWELCWKFFIIGGITWVASTLHLI
jgi:hypothetical protein